MLVMRIKLSQQISVLLAIMSFIMKDHCNELKAYSVGLMICFSSESQIR